MVCPLPAPPSVSQPACVLCTVSVTLHTMAHYGTHALCKPQGSSHTMLSVNEWSTLPFQQCPAAECPNGSAVVKCRLPLNWTASTKENKNTIYIGRSFLNFIVLYKKCQTMIWKIEQKKCPYANNVHDIKTRVYVHLIDSYMFISHCGPIRRLRGATYFQFS